MSPLNQLTYWSFQNTRQRSSSNCHSERSEESAVFTSKSRFLGLRPQNDTVGLVLSPITESSIRCQRTIDLSKLRDSVRQATVIPSAARNLLFSHPKADSSGFALGMTLSD